MSIVSSLGSNLLSSSALAGLFSPKSPLPDVYTQPSSFANNDSTAVSLSAYGRSLAEQAGALSDHVDDLSAATAKTAQNFLTDFARKFLGNSADGMQLSFDFASVSAHSSVAGMTQHTETGTTVSDLAALQVDEGADFVGRGTITTADGHKYSFEVQVHYEAHLEAAASASTTYSSGQGNDGRAPELNVNFPGKLKNLFKLLDNGALKLPFQLSPGDSGKDGHKSGTLMLTLLDMLDQPNALLQQLSKAYDDAPAKQKAAVQA